MKYVILVFLVVVSAIMTGCDDKEATEPDFTSADWFLDGPYTLLVQSEYEVDEKYIYQEVALVTKSRCTTMTINSKTLPFEDFYKEGEYYYNYFDYDSDTDGLIASPGSTVNYSFTTADGKTYPGSISLPATVNVTFPSFDLNTDFNVSWNSSPRPDLHVVNYEIYPYYWKGSIYNYVQLAGTASNYKIPKAVWLELNESDLEIWFDVTAMKYKKLSSGALAVWAYSVDDWFDTVADSVRTGANGPRESRQHKTRSLLDRIMGGELIPR